MKCQGFSSSYSTPTTINPEEVKASYKNGVLEVRAEKAGIKETRKFLYNKNFVLQDKVHTLSYSEKN